MRWWPPDAIDVSVFLVGWTLGWLLLWRPRPLPSVPGDRRGADAADVAVIVPARNEAAVLPHLLPPLVAQLRAGDELVVVDDHSDDDTASVAAAHGAAVITAPELPSGWLGKPHACWVGAQHTRAATLVFLDADVRPAEDLLVRLGVAVEAEPDAVVSVQPWHVTDTPSEQASMLGNVTALMGCAAFTPLGPRVAATVAFGPVIALSRAAYDRAGGHADRVVRTMHTEDIGLARTVGRSVLFTGAPDTLFRMYPGGFGDTVRGWSRSIATGARSVRWWAAIATLAWVASLAGGWLAAPIVYPLSALQFYVLGRRAGSMHPLTAAFFPLAVAVFAVMFVRSAWAVAARRTVHWKSRRVPASSS